VSASPLDQFEYARAIRHREHQPLIFVGIVDVPTATVGDPNLSRAQQAESLTLGMHQLEVKVGCVMKYQTMMADTIADSPAKTLAVRRHPFYGAPPPCPLTRQIFSNRAMLGY
jgi:hypothetical protein